ncbi:GIY-YIG nuclease family protein [Marinitoga lauensis]|uniref:GIY-YIG nuclease family protein n=1 Tax=Marinitoga lauensis TaxID=2201189 RepID=UPI00101261C1|nr:DUF123 domain-containing protein [Marinitoga lauensis]
MNKGSYILLIEIEKSVNLSISKKKSNIEKGLYAYCGSAMKNLIQRVNRHMNFKNGKYKKHWHIDNLLEIGNIKQIFLFPSANRMEEEISVLLSKYFKSIKGFGATDLKVESNLFFIDDITKFGKILKIINDKL